jgi:hypothetical protein
MSIKAHSLITLVLVFGGFAWVIATQGKTAIPMLFIILGFFSALELGLRAVIKTLTKKHN